MQVGVHTDRTLIHIRIRIRVSVWIISYLDALSDVYG